MSRIKEWLDEDHLILLEGWARDGLTEEQIAHNIGISLKTLYNWKNSNLQILQAIKKGKEVVDFEVENALLKSALEGNITAQIFWLKNRKQKEWREKVVTENEVKINNGIIGELVEVLKDEKNTK